MKLFVSDVDGTLYKKDINGLKGCSKENVVAIKKWIEKGNMFAVATARHVGCYEELTEQLEGIKVNYIGDNGASLVFLDGTFKQTVIEAKYYIEVCNYMEEHQFDGTVFLNHNNKLYLSSYNKYPLHKKIDFLEGRECLSFNTLLKQEAINKFTMIVNPKYIQKIKEELKIKYDGKLQIVNSDFDNLDFGALNTSKGKGVLTLMQKYNIDKDNLITIGDSENDISMLQVTKHSYAMKSADKQIQEEASYCVSSVAEAIEMELNKL